MKNYKNIWYYRFKEAIEKRKSLLIKLPHNNEYELLHRETGKTYALEELACEYALPLLTSDKRVKFYEKRNGVQKVESYNVFNSYDTLRGICSPAHNKIVLVDDCFYNEQAINDLANRGYILIGFKSDSK